MPQPEKGEDEDEKADERPAEGDKKEHAAEFYPTGPDNMDTTA